MGEAWNQGPLEHGKKICSSFKSNEVIQIKSNRKSRNKSEKFSKKRKFRNPGCHNDQDRAAPSGRLGQGRSPTRCPSGSGSLLEHLNFGNFLGIFRDTSFF